VSATNPRIEWPELEEWYATIIHPAWSWFKVYDDLVKLDPTLTASNDSLRDIEAQLLASQDQVRNTLLRACETVLKRPGRRITEPHELRFLLIITANPLLHSSYKPFVGGHFHSAEDDLNRTSSLHRGTGPSSGRHSGIIKRIAGLISNAPAECHNHLVAWVTRYPDLLFVQTKDLFSEFLVYRLVRQNQKKYEPEVDITGGLIPSIGAGQSVASLHAALGHRPRGSNNKRKGEPKKIVFQEDWQTKAAAQVLGLVFTANNISRHARRGLPGSLESSGPERPQRRGQFLATSDFYVTLLDELDLVADFDAWERNKGRFSFCYYPFLLTIGSKIRILEYEARRQMESIARDIFFDNILNNRGIQQHLVLNIRRECLVEDSLKAVSEVVGGGGEDIKKGLKITFRGEEGVDAGGLRKEWFLLLVREVFNPDHGMIFLPPSLSGRYGTNFDQACFSTTKTPTTATSIPTPSSPRNSSSSSA
jgi:E3 ubiquitin-protein ligase HECTD2